MFHQRRYVNKSGTSWKIRTGVNFQCLAKQKARGEITGTRLSLDEITKLLGSHDTLMCLLFFATIKKLKPETMGSESEIEQSYESDDSEYNFIQGYEIEVEEKMIRSDLFWIMVV